MQDTPDRAAAWEAEGRRLAPALDGVSAALVAGHDVTAASHLALGLAAVQAMRRRVAVGDLTGAAQPLTQLVAAQVTDEDPHGLTDVFTYGASLNRVARQVDPDGRLFVVPVGSEPPDEGVVGADRWSRIAAGFRDVGALLLVVAPADTPQLAALAAQLDGTVAADHGDATQGLPNVLATAQTPDEALPLAGAPRPRRTAADDERVGLRRLHPALLAAAGLLAVALLVWLALTVGGGRDDARPIPRADTASVPASVAAGAVELDDTGAAAGEPTTGEPTTREPAAAAAPGPAPPPVANPEELDAAAGYAVELASLPDEAAARRVFASRPVDLLGTTMAPVMGGDGAVRYRVTAGGYARPGEAQTVLRRVRNDGIIPETAGSVVRLPYAVQLESGVPRESLTPVINRFLSQGIAAYPMRQPNGSSHIYVGAFAEPAEARALLSSLQAANVPAALVVRIGRPW